MRKTRMWTLGLLVGLFAAGDWFVERAPADGDEKDKPAVMIGDAAVTAVERTVEKDGKKEKHIFLELRGEGVGKLKLRLDGTNFNPYARMMPRPRRIWERDITIDTGKEKSIDLGVVPTSLDKTFYELTASTDGKGFVRVLGIGGGFEPGLELTLQPDIKNRAALIAPPGAEK